VSPARIARAASSFGIHRAGASIDLLGERRSPPLLDCSAGELPSDLLTVSQTRHVGLSRSANGRPRRGVWALLLPRSFCRAPPPTSGGHQAEDRPLAFCAPPVGHQRGSSIPGGSKDMVSPPCQARREARRGLGETLRPKSRARTANQGGVLFSAELLRDRPGPQVVAPLQLVVVEAPRLRRLSPCSCAAACADRARAAIALARIRGGGRLDTMWG